MAACCICYASLTSNKLIVTPECGHVFHKECLYTWFGTDLRHPTCPNCRHKVNLGLLRRLHLDCGENSSIQNNSIVEDLHKNVITMSEKLVEMERKLTSQEKKYATLSKSKQTYQERAATFKKEIVDLKKINNELKKRLTEESKQRKFYENECLALTAQLNEMRGHDW